MTAAEDNRFLNVAEGDIDDFITSMKNANTSRKTKSDVKLLTEWLLKTQNEQRQFEDIECDKLDQYLARFFLSVRYKKGEAYEPDTLKSIQSSIRRTEKNEELDEHFD